MGSAAISQSQTFSSENISKALLIIGIGVFTYSGVSKAVNKVAKMIFEKNSSKPQLAAIIASFVVVGFIVTRAIFWESSKVQLHFVVILLGYVVERVAFYIWGKADSSKTVFPGYMWDLVAMEIKNEENESMIGHEEAIENIATLLHSKRKTNALLLGLPGVGKTAIAKNFAYKLGKKLFPPIPFFKNIRLIEIRIGTLLADITWTETIEDRVAKIIEIGSKYPQIVFFIDRDDTLVNGQRLDYHITLLKQLLPYTENGRIKVLATLTWEEYKLYILPEDSLRRFINIVQVKSPSPTKCFNMLRCRYLKYNQNNDFKVSDQAIAAAVFFSGSISSHQFPDKAIDLVEHALSRVDLEKPMDKEVENLSESSDDETVSGSSEEHESISERSDDERLPRASIVIEVHSIVKNALAQYQWTDSHESLVQQYKQYINEHPNDFPGLHDGDSLWVSSRPSGPLLLTDKA